MPGKSKACTGSRSPQAAGEGNDERDIHRERPFPAENGNAPVRRTTVVRSPQELDYRLRGLILDPEGGLPTAPVQPERQRRRPRRLSPLAAKVAAFVIAAALAGWLLQAFVAQPFVVPGSTMAPTIQSGDRILVVKAAFLESPVRSGQIVVVRPPRFLPCTVRGTAGAGDLVLRVVAVPGQTIWSIGQTIFVDGRTLQEKGWYSPRSGPVGSRRSRAPRWARTSTSSWATTGRAPATRGPSARCPGHRSSARQSPSWPTITTSTCKNCRPREPGLRGGSQGGE